MWTLLWIDKGFDKWDRFNNLVEVEEVINNLKENPYVCENDIWIFPPESDENAMSYDELNSLLHSL